MQVSYDPEFEPVMSCVIDLSLQYCEVDGIKETDPWCTTLEVSWFDLLGFGWKLSTYTYTDRVGSLAWISTGVCWLLLIFWSTARKIP